MAVIINYTSFGIERKMEAISSNWRATDRYYLSPKFNKWRIFRKIARSKSKCSIIVFMNMKKKNMKLKWKAKKKRDSQPRRTLETILLVAKIIAIVDVVTSVCNIDASIDIARNLVLRAGNFRCRLFTTRLSFAELAAVPCIRWPYSIPRYLSKLLRF